jgi:hypothetical protein
MEARPGVLAESADIEPQRARRKELRTEEESKTEEFSSAYL